MKTLDVASLLTAVEVTIKDIDDKNAEIKKVQSAVRDFYSLDKELKGQGGSAIRGFYQNMYEPFLVFLQTSLKDYEKALTEIKEKVTAFESNDENGYISQAFLENDVTEGFNQVGEEAQTFVNDANGILDDVSHLVTPPKIDESVLMDHVNDGKQKANEIIQDLITVDHESASCLEETEENLKIMHMFLSEMSQKFTSSSSIANFSLKSTYDITGYQTIRDEYDETINEIKRKMLEGGNLNEEEREILYMHLQNKFTAEDLDKINKTKDYLLHDNEKLKTYINETVLATESSLESEILLLEEYLFTGNKKPSELEEDTGERVALRSYLDALKNYHASINEVKNELNWNTDKNDPLFARVESIEFDFDGKTQFSNHGILETQIAISYDQENNHLENRQDFLDLEPRFEGHFPVLGHHNISNIEYYYGQNAITNRMNVEDDKLKDDMSTMNGEYIGSELLGLAIGMARDVVSIPAGLLASRAEHLYEKSEMEEDLNWFEIKKPASQFKLEMKINDRASINTSNVKQAELYPTVETYNMLERWEAIHQEEKSFPYDAEAISNHDWNELYKLFHENTSSDELIFLNEQDLELYFYMLDGTIPEDEYGNNKNPTIEKIEQANE